MQILTKITKKERSSHKLYMKLTFILVSCEIIVSSIINFKK